jgi:exopolyphosphatase / guanosine-5'-triphosphate,3'-diphosphate pyrophosphatase
VRVAAVDCGTNSIKLLVADLDPVTGAQADLVREQRIVRLGEAVDRTGTLAPAALDRTLAAADEYAGRLRSLGAERVGVAATSAVRDAANGSVLVSGLRDRLGADPRVLSGTDEAALSYAGAVHGLGEQAHAELLLVDVGGGSTELVRGRGADVATAGSADVGSVRMTERHLRGDPATSAQVAVATADVDAALDRLAVPLADAQTLVVVGGTAMTVAAHALALDRLDEDRLHGSRLEVSRVRASCAALLATTVADRRAMGFMLPSRADVIGGGALVLDRVLARTGTADVLASSHDVVDGVAWTLVR